MIRYHDTLQMVRYHRSSLKCPSGGFLVSTRRKPRGYIVKVTEIRRVYRSPSRYEASVDWEQYDGWKAVSLSGYTNRVVYSTKQKAAEALLTNHNFWMDIPGSVQFSPIVFTTSVNSRYPVLISPC